VPAVLQTPSKKSLFPAGILAVDFDAMHIIQLQLSVVNFNCHPKSSTSQKKKKTMKNMVGLQLE